MSQDLTARLRALPHRRRALAAGETLFLAGDPVRALHLLERGGIRLVRRDEQGGEITLETTRAGQIAAEASVFSQRYHCDAVATEPTDLLAIRRADLDAAFQGDPTLALAYAGHLARALRRARDRAAILALKTVAERLDAWTRLVGGAPPERGGWKALAAELGVTPEALYRERARRRTAAQR